MDQICPNSSALTTGRRCGYEPRNPDAFLKHAYASAVAANRLTSAAGKKAVSESRYIAKAKRDKRASENVYDEAGYRDVEAERRNVSRWMMIP